MSGVAHVRLDHVSATIEDAGSSRTILDEISIQVAGGELVTIEGPSGVGKTTLLSLVAMITKPTTGNVFINGQDPWKLHDQGRAALRLSLEAIVFQNARLISVMTIREQLSLAGLIRGMPDLVDDGLVRLRAYGLTSQVDCIPAKLSGGERQRAALAIALASKPAILLADEPTAGLDEVNSEFLATEVRRYVEETNAAALCVTHDSVLMSIAHRRLHLKRPPGPGNMAGKESGCIQ